MKLLEQACHDILYKNMGYTDQIVYLLYDTESPLAKMLADAYKVITSPLCQSSRVGEPASTTLSWWDDKILRTLIPKSKIE